MTEDLLAAISILKEKLAKVKKERDAAIMAIPHLCKENTSDKWISVKEYGNEPCSECCAKDFCVHWESIKEEST